MGIKTQLLARKLSYQSFFLFVKPIVGLRSGVRDLMYAITCKNHLKLNNETYALTFNLWLCEFLIINEDNERIISQKSLNGNRVDREKSNLIELLRKIKQT